VSRFVFLEEPWSAMYNESSTYIYIYMLFTAPGWVMVNLDI